MEFRNEIPEEAKGQLSVLLFANWYIVELGESCSCHQSANRDHQLWEMQMKSFREQVKAVYKRSKLVIEFIWCYVIAECKRHRYTIP
jgi:hypothetical protein